MSDAPTDPHSFSIAVHRKRLTKKNPGAKLQAIKKNTASSTSSTSMQLSVNRPQAGAQYSVANMEISSIFHAERTRKDTRSRPQTALRYQLDPAKPTVISRRTAPQPGPWLWPPLLLDSLAEPSFPELAATCWNTR